MKSDTKSVTSKQEYEDVDDQIRETMTEALENELIDISSDNLEDFELDAVESMM